MSEAFGPDTATLASRLAPALAASTGSSIASIARRPSAYRTSSPLEEITLTMRNGARIELMLKVLGRAAMSDTARGAKPDFIDDPRREIDVYERLLRGAGLGTAECVASLIDEEAQQYWIVIETVPGVELYQVGDLPTWQAVAVWLARFHRSFARQVESPTLPGSRTLLRWDRSYCNTWLERARRFMTHASAAAPVLDRLGRHWNDCVARILALPPTLLHGEFYPSNIIVDVVAGNPARICAIDWEMAAIGPGLMDLAALTAGKWSDGERDRIVAAYLDEAGPELVGRRGRGDLELAITCCRIQVAVQWLGWARDWQPPASDVHDWVAELGMLLDRIPQQR